MRVPQALLPSKCGRQKEVKVGDSLPAMRFLCTDLTGHCVQPIQHNNTVVKIRENIQNTLNFEY